MLNFTNTEQKREKITLKRVFYHLNPQLNRLDTRGQKPYWILKYRNNPPRILQVVPYQDNVNLREKALNLAKMKERRSVPSVFAKSHKERELKAIKTYNLEIERRENVMNLKWDSGGKNKQALKNFNKIKILLVRMYLTTEKIGYQIYHQKPEKIFFLFSSSFRLFGESLIFVVQPKVENKSVKISFTESDMFFKSSSQGFDFELDMQIPWKFLNLESNYKHHSCFPKLVDLFMNNVVREMWRNFDTKFLVHDPCFKRLEIKYPLLYNSFGPTRLFWKRCIYKSQDFSNFDYDSLMNFILICRVVFFFSLLMKKNDHLIEKEQLVRN